MDRADFLIKRAERDGRVAALLLRLRHAQETCDRLAAERIYDTLEDLVPSRTATGARLYTRIDATIASRAVRDRADELREERS